MGAEATSDDAVCKRSDLSEPPGMPDNAAHIVVNALAVEEMEEDVQSILMRLFPGAAIELASASSLEPMILDVLFLDPAPGTTEGPLVSRGEEMALEVERRLHDVLKR